MFILQCVEHGLSYEGMLDFPVLTCWCSKAAGFGAFWISKLKKNPPSIILHYSETYISIYTHMCMHTNIYKCCNTYIGNNIILRAKILNTREKRFRHNTQKPENLYLYMLREISQVQKEKYMFSLINTNWKKWSHWSRDIKWLWDAEMDRWK